jgi:mannose-1-phosphate guanylyltransferase
VPDLWAGLASIEQALAAGRPLAEVLEEQYQGLRKISIDYALMEKAPNVLTLPGVFDWDDVGAWPALLRHLPADAKGNVTRGNALVVDGADNIVVGSGEHLVSLLGVSGCIVVHTEDATMICPRERAQDIKLLVGELSKDPRLCGLL